jgi:hypothetical protein
MVTVDKSPPFMIKTRCGMNLSDIVTLINMLVSKDMASMASG